MKTVHNTGIRHDGSANVQAEMQSMGYAHYQLALPSELNGKFLEFRKAYDDAPADPYAKQGGRRRLYGVGICDPANDELLLTSRRWYEQETTYNPEEKGSRREFAPLGPIASNPFLHHVILNDMRGLPDLAPEYKNEFFQVGIHLIRMLATPGQPCVASPNRLHKDGEPATFIHLIARKGVKGGETWIAKDSQGEQMLAKFTLESELETASVNDSLVYHHVSPVEVEDGLAQGYRDVLLIDFTPIVRTYRCPFRQFVSS